MGHYYYYTNDPDKVYAYPHYSDERFRGGKLIYGKDEGAQGEYSDRLWEWNATAGEHATEVCNTSGLTARTARRSELWLSTYYDRPVVLRGIIGEFNAATGYPLYFYRFDFAEQP